MVLEKADSHMQKMKLDPSLTTSTKDNSEWIKDLNIRTKTIQLLENIGEELHDQFCNDFLDVIPKAQIAK